MGVELGVGQDALCLELCEILELRDRVPCRHRGLGRRRILGLRLLLCILLIVLLRPAVLLSTRDAVRHRRGSSGDSCSTRIPRRSGMLRPSFRSAFGGVECRYEVGLGYVSGSDQLGLTPS